MADYEPIPLTPFLEAMGFKKPIRYDVEAVRREIKNRRLDEGQAKEHG